jgi:uncharacterized membrane protein (DUF485 family)
MVNPPADSNPKERIDDSRWDHIAASTQFQQLLLQKKQFIIPAFLFFLAYYLLLPILLAYAPRLMSTRVFGTVTLAYLYALSQFVVGWTIAWLYMRASFRFDRLVKDVLAIETLEKNSIVKSLAKRQDSLRGEH